jgi:transcriptional regulator with XRE-family HTH domain
LQEITIFAPENLKKVVIMRVKEVLKEKGLTQPELAEKLGVSVSAVKQMVGADSVTTATLEKIAAAIDVPVWQFFISPDDLANQVGGNSFCCPHCGKPLKIMAG